MSRLSFVIRSLFTLVPAVPSTMGPVPPITSVFSPFLGPPLALGLGLQSGLWLYVHQDLVGPHRLHKEGREEGMEEGE